MVTDGDCHSSVGSGCQSCRSRCEVLTGSGGVGRRSQIFWTIKRDRRILVEQMGTETSNEKCHNSTIIARGEMGERPIDG